MMSEPVAYVNNMCNDSIDWKVDPISLAEGTPLYTTPQTKPLSDEEIVELVNKHIDYVPDDDNGMMVIGINDLCRAIEVKVRGDK